MGQIKFAQRFEVGLSSGRIIRLQNEQELVLFLSQAYGIEGSCVDDLINQAAVRGLIISKGQVYKTIATVVRQFSDIVG